MGGGYRRNAGRGCLGEHPSPILLPLCLRALPVWGCGHMARGALVYPAAVVSTSPRACPKYDAEVPRSWASLPTPSHWRGAAPLCTAKGTPAPWGGGDRPRCRGAPAGRWAGLCPAALPADPSTHHPRPPCSRDLMGVPHCPPQPHRELVCCCPRSSTSTQADPKRRGGPR